MILFEDTIDQCLSNPCLNGSTCVDGNGEYTCICADGFEGTKCDIGKSLYRSFFTLYEMKKKMSYYISVRNKEKTIQ